MPDATATRPNANTYWVVPHKFLAGEYPGDEDSVRAREKINRFLEGGVRHFVDLTEQLANWSLTKQFCQRNPGKLALLRLTNGFRSEMSACREMRLIWARSF